MMLSFSVRKTWSSRNPCSTRSTRAVAPPPRTCCAGSRITRTLAELGYRLQCRRVAVPTQPLREWVRQGKGYRGAMLPTSFKRLHPGDKAAGKDAPDDAVGYHAVGVTMEQLDPKVRAPEELVMIDPWPGLDGKAEARAKVTPLVELAHKDRGLHALMFFWSGWS